MTKSLAAPISMTVTTQDCCPPSHTSTYLISHMNICMWCLTHFSSLNRESLTLFSSSRVEMYLDAEERSPARDL